MSMGKVDPIIDYARRALRASFVDGDFDVPRLHDMARSLFQGLRAFPCERAAC